MAISRSDIKTHKRKFDKGLRHIKTILAHERHRLTMAEWLRLVQATKQCIMEAPEEFLCGDLPGRPLLLMVLEQVFEGFLEDQRLLSLQKSNVRWRP